MAFCYKKLWHQLIDHDMSRTDLRDATGMAPATLAKLSKGEAVGTPTLEKICNPDWGIKLSDANWERRGGTTWVS